MNMSARDFGSGAARQQVFHPLSSSSPPVSNNIDIR
jgi:hypothetical protein